MKILDFDIKFAIIDLECLEDYFSLQVSNEKNDIVGIIECTENSHFFKLYNKLKKSTRPMYVFSIDYDKTMLNAMCKVIEQINRGFLKDVNINEMLREINNYLIPKVPADKVNYFRLNREFWQYKIKYEKDNPTRDFKDCYDYALQRIKTQYTGKPLEFIEKYHFLFGKSPLFKKLTINEIPRIYYYIVINKDKEVRPSISLKKLQLIREGYNVKFDFNKYKTIAAVKEDGLYDDWIKYSKNDITSLKKLFMDKPLDDIRKRIYAIKAVQKIKPDFKWTNDMIFSENNTNLICGILGINNPNKKIVIDYPNYIKTNFKPFNDFVNFVNQNSSIEKDRDIKKMYCAKYNVDYIEDDKNIVDGNNVDLRVGSFNSFFYKDLELVFGLGGIHAAVADYIGDDLDHLDYTSQYPSVILQYKELFKNIIDVDLYEAIYNMRVEYKAKLKTLEYGSDEYKECELIVIGLKLILNSAYGLINSNFNLPISCKPLGRFICLKCQSLLLNLLEKLINPINVNTDGVIWKNDGSLNVNQIIKEDENGYFKLDNTKIEKIIQNNVNNYIKVVNGRMKTKGKYNISIKQQINTDEKLSVNLENALNLFQNKEIECYPIYFGKKIDIKHGTDIPYYLTNEKQGYPAIKALVKPLILNIDNQKLYFTSDKDKADKEIYQLYAEKTLKKIYDFTLFTKSKSIMPFIECVLTPDSDENNKIKNKIKLKLYRMFGSELINFKGYKGDLKHDSFRDNTPIKTLIHYKKTQILKSTYCKGFGLSPKGKFLIIDVDIYDKKTGKNKEGWEIIKPLLEELDKLETFQCWNDKTLEYGNKKYIFKYPHEKILKINPEYKKYIEILTNTAAIWSLPKCTPTYDNNWNIPVSIPINLSKKIIK